MDHGTLMFTWNSMFGNRRYGEGDDAVLGTKGAILRDEADRVRYVPESGNHPASGEEKATGASATPDIVGGSDSTDAHLQNFFDCVRTRKQPNCPFELGFSSAIACRMALVAYREGRRVQWDAGSEEIV
jgi:hypothetical protein